MESTVERVADRRDIPAAVARYVDALDTAAARSRRRSRARACAGRNSPISTGPAAGLAIEARPTQGQDRLGITGTFCAIAETGTLVVLAGADTPTATTLLPDTHVAVVRADRIVSGMEEAFALIRSERGQLPRAVNLISGPIAHRRHRADDRARRARAVPRSHPRARLRCEAGPTGRSRRPPRRPAAAAARRRVDEIAEEARHRHAPILGDRLDHEVRRVADVGERAEIDRPIDSAASDCACSRHERLRIAAGEIEEHKIGRRVVEERGQESGQPEDHHIVPVARAVGHEREDPGQRAVAARPRASRARGRS